MTDAHELVGLPGDGPTSLELAKAWLRLADTRDDTELRMVVAAVNSQVRTWPVSSGAVAQNIWPERIQLGATMLAARLHRRRNTPAGVEAFGSDGAVYVSRLDPDIAQLLQLGSYQPPAVG